MWYSKSRLKDYSNFENMLATTDWKFVKTGEVDSSFDNLVVHIAYCYNTSCPIVTPSKQTKDVAPLINNAVRESNRNLRTMWEIATTTRNPLFLEYGVSQDSTLCPLIFLLYISDFYENVKDGLIVNYADDMTLIVTAPQQSELVSGVRRIVGEVNQ